MGYCPEIPGANGQGDTSAITAVSSTREGSLPMAERTSKIRKLASPPINQESGGSGVW